MNNCTCVKIGSLILCEALLASSFGLLLMQPVVRGNSLGLQ